MRQTACLVFCLLAGCATLQPERRLALRDQQYRVPSVAVVPFTLTYRACTDDIDRKARSADLFGSITGTAASALRRRGYGVQALFVDPDDASLKGYYKALDQLLCRGALPASLPDEVMAFAKAQGKKAKVKTVLVGGVSRLRWHLKLDTQQENGLVGNGSGTLGEFTVRAATALIDLETERVVWSESVEGTLLANDYADAINQLFLFAEPRTTDPHDKLFYDFPPAAGAAPAPAAASNPLLSGT